MNAFTINRMTWIFIVSIATAILAIASGYLQYKDKLDSTAKSLKKEEELNNVYKQLQNKSDEIIGSTKQILQLNEKLINANEEIIKLQSKLEGTYSGGNSFPELKIIPLDNEKGQMLLIHHGGFPLFDISMHAVDLDIHNQIVTQRGSNQFKMDELSLFSVDLQFNNLQIANQLAIGTFLSDYSSDKKSFNIFYSARNGLFIQALRLFKKNNNWHSATMIYNREYKEIYRNISKDFPMDLFDWNVKEKN
ncbi:hypothetical protein SAMN05428988_4387 [Chitinophaga sp. YR573]|uniref:hypothetical protein n=1 Tax=Chitinophaga sp. YR573 TaxID=1881040 RepID=UPI0008C86DBA|nr:hypothetical protein [Chitinophaga sp. YR573]SEW35763.1 hypothetical protein SAMN05428988_4387 [Chitinophaga sp. YR573]